MKGKLPKAGRGDATRWSADLKLLNDPLEYIREDRMHMRSVCEAIEDLSRCPETETGVILRLRHFLEHELGLFIQDEDGDLRELLLIHCMLEDEIEPTLVWLAAEHEVFGDLYPRLAPALNRMRDCKRAASEGRPRLWPISPTASAVSSVENAIVLPIARARLTEADIAHLPSAMIRCRVVGMQM